MNNLTIYYESTFTVHGKVWRFSCYEYRSFDADFYQILCRALISMTKFQK